MPSSAHSSPGSYYCQPGPRARSCSSWAGPWWSRGAVLTRWVRQPPSLAVIVIPALLASGLLAVVDGPCEVETAYHCAYVTDGGSRSTGRILWLDTLRHSYVDLEDPTHLEFRYSKVMANAVDAMLADTGIETLFIGGGGFTLPRYFPAVRPGSRSTVLEIDDELVDLVASDLGLDPDDPAVRVRLGDARLLIVDEAKEAFDLVIGDAFGGLAVPWHLTTEEFTELIADRLAPDGIYLLNVIDHPPSRFVRSETQTLRAVFAHVAVAGPRSYMSLTAGGNFVLIGSNAPIDTSALLSEIAARGGTEVVLVDDELNDFIDGARVLTDDFAPVDQLISRR